MSAPIPAKRSFEAAISRRQHPHRGGGLLLRSQGIGPPYEHYGMDRYLSELNRFYSATATPVEAASGEVLEFIGDAFLAIFPIERFGDAREACGAALEAVAWPSPHWRRTTMNAAWPDSRNSPAASAYTSARSSTATSEHGPAELRDRKNRQRGGEDPGEMPRSRPSPLVSEAFSTTLPIEWQDQGAHSLKNISQPMRFFSPAGAIPYPKTEPV